MKYYDGIFFFARQPESYSDTEKRDERHTSTHYGKESFLKNMKKTHTPAPALAPKYTSTPYRDNSSNDEDEEETPDDETINEIRMSLKTDSSKSSKIKRDLRNSFKAKKNSTQTNIFNYS